VIGILDYDMGNIGSIANMLKRLRGECIIASDAAQLLSCQKLILPGVGAFDTAIQHLKDKGLWEALQHFALQEKKPVLGICLGMQLMCLGSEEGNLPGLGWFNTNVRRFQFSGLPNSDSLRIPHMGWNLVDMQDPSFALFKDWEPEMRFYFVHSYAVQDVDAFFAKGLTRHGYPFVSVMGHENLMGFQCHPEKSHRYGMLVYKNFIEL
jgi:glutamine amidotransferase